MHDHIRYHLHSPSHKFQQDFQPIPRARHSANNGQATWISSSFPSLDRSLSGNLARRERSFDKLATSEPYVSSLTFRRFPKWSHPSKPSKLHLKDSCLVPSTCRIRLEDFQSSPACPAQIGPAEQRVDKLPKSSPLTKFGSLRVKNPALRDWDAGKSFSRKASGLANVRQKTRSASKDSSEQMLEQKEPGGKLATKCSLQGHQK